MSETVKYSGELKRIDRLENETDKDYFERVTNVVWQRYKYEPESLSEAITENDISYYEARYVDGRDCYIALNNTIYKIESFIEKDIKESFCDLKQCGDTITFEAQYYNGAASLEEIIEDELNNM